MRDVKVLAVLCATALAAACSASPQPRLYVLAPLGGADAVSAAVHGVGVGVGPVTLAPHLDRPQIVTRRGGEVELGELDRWAEPLADGVARVLAENLGALLATERTWIHPWRPSVTPDYQVTVDVMRCDRDGGEAVLIARWTLFGEAGMLSARRFEHREPLSSPDPPAAVEALGRDLAALSREMASEIARHAASAD